MGMYNTEPITDFGLACEKGSSMTKQSMKDECDINKILAKVQKTGMLEHLAQGTPFYGDVSDLVDYKEALNVIKRANELFMDMSPEIRERFDNDPAKMLEFLENKDNLPEAIELGMVLPPPEKPKEESKVAEQGGQASAPK